MSAVKLAIILTATMEGAKAFNEAEGGVKGLGAAAKAAVPMIGAFAAAATFDFMKESIATATEFNKVIADAGVAVGKSATEMGLYAREIREMSLSIPKTPNEMGIGLYEVLDAGITDVAGAMNALESASKMAVLGQTDVKTAVEGGMKTMTAFGLEAADLNHIYDVQFKTMQYGMVQYNELESIMSNLAPTAIAAGQSMESLYAAIAVLTQKGMDANKAAMSLKTALDGITDPKNIRKADELGISFVNLSDDAKSARTTFYAQKSALDDLTQSYSSATAEIRAMGAEMDKLSLQEAKNNLEIERIIRNAEEQGRTREELTAEELSSIAALEKANSDLQFQYDEMNVAQMEAQITADEMSTSLEAQKVATEAASEAFDDQIAVAGEFNTLGDIIDQINTKYGALSDVAQADIISQLFPSDRAQVAITSIMGSEEEMIALTEEMMTTAGEMESAFGTRMAGTTEATTLATASITDLQLELGNALIPVLNEFIPIIRDTIVPMLKESFIPIIESLMPIVQGVADAVGFLAGLFRDYPVILYALIAAFVAWKVATVAATVVSAAQTAATWLSTAATWAFNTALWANPIVWVVAAIIALIAVIYLLITHWDDVKAALESAWDALSGFADWVMSGLKAAFDYIVSGLQWIWDGLKDVYDFIVGSLLNAWEVLKLGIQSFVDIVMTILQPFIDILEWIWDLIESIIDAVSTVTDALGAVGDAVGGGIGKVGDFLGFAEGGIVTEPTLGMVGEAGDEAVIPLQNGAVPVEVIGGAAGGSGVTIESHDTISLVIQTGALPENETPESLERRISEALYKAKMKYGGAALG